MSVVQLRQSQQQDADAVFIHELMDDVDKLKSECKESEKSSSVKKTLIREKNITIGLRLIEVRAKFPDRDASGKQGFVAWYESNGFARNTVYNLMKLAGQTDAERDVDDAAKAAIKKASRDAKAAEEQKGWRIEALDTGLIKQGFDGKTGKKVRTEIAEYLGNGVTEKTVKDQPQSDLRRACVAIAIMRDPDAAKQKTEDEVKTLPEKMQVKFERLLNARVFQIETDFWNKVNETVEKRVAEEVKEAKEAKERYEGLIKPLHGIMSKNDFRTVLSCLASDKHPEDQRAKYDHATAIFNKLKPKIKW